MSSQKDIERELYDTALTDGNKEIPQAIGQPNDPTIIAADVTLAYESGLNIQARSQWGYVWRRFVRHKLAMASAAVLAVVFLVAIFAPQVAPYRYD